MMLALIVGLISFGTGVCFSLYMYQKILDEAREEHERARRLFDECKRVLTETQATRGAPDA